MLIGIVIGLSSAFFLTLDVQSIVSRQRKRPFDVCRNRAVAGRHCAAGLLRAGAAGDKGRPDDCFTKRMTETQQ